MEDRNMTGVYVQCPALSNQAVDVEETCTRCRFFSTVLCTNTSESVPWSDRHQIICQYPRRLMPITIAGADDAISEIESRVAAKAVSKAGEKEPSNG